MSIQFFSFRAGEKNHLFLPREYRRTVAWVPQMGDIFPNFSVDTTDGRLNFFDWAEGHWSYLFSHPAAMTPVCTSEVLSLSSSLHGFEDRDVKLLGFSGSSIENQLEWHRDIERLFGVSVGIPFVADTGNRLARSFGMMHDKQSSKFPIRKSFIIDPEMRIRMIFEYPIGVARSTDEVLRMIDAFQVHRRTGLAVPADWQPGDDLLHGEDRTDDEMRSIYGSDFVRLTNYLAIVRNSYFLKSRGSSTS